MKKSPIIVGLFTSCFIKNTYVDTFDGRAKIALYKAPLKRIRRFTRACPVLHQV